MPAQKMPPLLRRVDCVRHAENSIQSFQKTLRETREMVIQVVREDQDDNGDPCCRMNIHLDDAFVESFLLLPIHEPPLSMPPERTTPTTTTISLLGGRVEPQHARRRRHQRKLDFTLCDMAFTAISQHADQLHTVTLHDISIVSNMTKRAFEALDPNNKPNLRKLVFKGCIVVDNNNNDDDDDDDDDSDFGNIVSKVLWRIQDLTIRNACFSIPPQTHHNPVPNHRPHDDTRLHPLIGTRIRQFFTYLRKDKMPQLSCFSWIHNPILSSNLLAELFHTILLEQHAKSLTRLCFREGSRPPTIAAVVMAQRNILWLNTDDSSDEEEDDADDNNGDTVMTDSDLMIDSDYYILSRLICSMDRLQHLDLQLAQASGVALVLNELEKTARCRSGSHHLHTLRLELNVWKPDSVQALTSLLETLASPPSQSKNNNTKMRQFSLISKRPIPSMVPLVHAIHKQLALEKVFLKCPLLVQDAKAIASSILFHPALKTLYLGDGRGFHSDALLALFHPDSRKHQAHNQLMAKKSNLHCLTLYAAQFTDCIDAAKAIGDFLAGCAPKLTDLVLDDSAKKRPVSRRAQNLFHIMEPLQLPFLFLRHHEMGQIIDCTRFQQQDLPLDVEEEERLSPIKKTCRRVLAHGIAQCSNLERLDIGSIYDFDPYPLIDIVLRSNSSIQHLEPTMEWDNGAAETMSLMESYDEYDPRIEFYLSMNRLGRKRILNHPDGYLVLLERVLAGERTQQRVIRELREDNDNDILHHYRLQDDAAELFDLSNAFYFLRRLPELMDRRSFSS